MPICRQFIPPFEIVLMLIGLIGWGACGTATETRFHGIDFMPKSIVKAGDGRVRGQLASDTTIAGVRYKRGTRVSLSDKGRVEYMRLVAPTLIQGRVYTSTIAGADMVRGKQDRELTFSENGTLVTGMLGASATLHGITFPQGTFLYFDAKDGWLEHVVLSAPITVKGIEYMDHLYFRRDGQVSYGWLAQDTTLSGVILKRQTKVTYWPSGELHSGTLAEPHCPSPGRNNCPHPAGTLLVFSKGGSVVKALDP
jgi:hypothetical protein